MKRIARALLGLALLGPVLVSASACKPKAASKTPAKITLPVVLQASADSNEGRPVYVVVRSTSEVGFVSDTYAEIAKLVIEPDASVLATFVVFPGMVAYQQLDLSEMPEVVGVYCLFTDAKQGEWKLMFEGVEAIEVAVGLGELSQR